MVFRDVTDRRGAAAATERLAATLESMTDGFLRLDRDWRIVYMNPEFERQCQRPRSDQIAKLDWAVATAIRVGIGEGELFVPGERR